MRSNPRNKAQRVVGMTIRPHNSSTMFPFPPNTLTKDLLRDTQIHHRLSQ